MLKQAFLGCASLLVCANAYADVVIKNGSEYEIQAVYVSPQSMKNWGEDHLGNQTMDPGDQLTLTGVAPGTWDFRLEFVKKGSDKEFVCEIPGVDLDEGGDVSEFDNKTLKNCAKAFEQKQAAAEDDEDEEEDEEVAKAK